MDLRQAKRITSGASAARRTEGTVRAWVVAPVLIFAVLMFAASIAAALVPNDYAVLVLLMPVFVVGSVVVLLRPELALYISILYIPFESSQLQELALPGALTPSKLIGAGVVVILLFHVLFLRRPFRLLDDGQDYAVLLFAALMLYSAVAGFYTQEVLDSTIRMMRLMAYYFAVKNLLSSPQVIRTSMWLIVISVTFAAGWGILEFFLIRRVRVYDIRVGGFGMDPNDFAVLALVATMLALSLIPVTQHRLGKRVALFCVGVLVTGVLFTASRGGILTMGVTGLLYMWWHPNRKILLLLAVAALLVTMPFWPASIKERLIPWHAPEVTTMQVMTAQESMQRRLSYLDLGSDLLLAHPLLGVGYGAFSEYYPMSEYAQYDNPMTHNERFRIAHNTYLEIGAGMGVLGLGAYLLLLVIVWRDLTLVRRALPRHDFRWAAASGFQLSLFAFMFGSIFLSIEHFNYLWINVAVSSVLSHLSQRELLAARAAPRSRPLIEAAL